MDIELMPNPSNRNEFGKVIAGTVFMISVSTILIILSKNPWLLLFILPILIFIFFYFFGWEPQYISRPHHIEILDDGVVLHMRYGKGKIFVRYEDILWVSLPATDPKTNEPIYPDSYIGLGSRLGGAHLINWPLAVKIRERYESKLGVSLPKGYNERIQKKQC